MNPNTRYFDLSADDKLALDTDSLRRATEIEAANRGIAVPIELPELLSSSYVTGFHVPAESVGLYEIIIPGPYSISATGLCFRTEEEALRAIEGSICLKEDGYGAAARKKIVEGEVSFRKVFVTLRPGTTTSMKALETYQIVADPFYALADEIFEDLCGIRQERYTAGVTASKKAKYLDLAGGDEAVAKTFWYGIETTEWPTL